MIWIVEKKVVPHLLQGDGLMAELPLRVSFEYAVESGDVVDGSLSFKVLYNSRAVARRFPGIEEETLNTEVEKTANDAIDEHLVYCGFSRAAGPVSAKVVAAH